MKARLHHYRPVDLHLGAGMYWTVSDLPVAVEQRFGVVYETSYQRSAKVYRSKPSAAAMAQSEAELEKSGRFSARPLRRKSHRAGRDEPVFSDHHDAPLVAQGRSSTGASRAVFRLDWLAKYAPAILFEV